MDDGFRRDAPKSVIHPETYKKLRLSKFTLDSLIHIKM